MDWNEGMDWNKGMNHLPPDAAAIDSLLPSPMDPTPPTDVICRSSTSPRYNSRMHDVQRFLSDSVNSNTIIGDAQMEIVSKEITAAINEVIVNGATLLSCSGQTNAKSEIPHLSLSSTSLTFDVKNLTKSDLNIDHLKDEIDSGFPKTKGLHEEIGDDWDIVEFDAVELLAEHFHLCDLCGKDFKRDANVRMHMRAHGNKFKTLEALSKPEKSVVDSESTRVRIRRFSCPFTGCSRNRLHKKFRPLKSVICVKDHFKRSHCPKIYSCNRCHKKNFSVLADLKSHLKHCGEIKWKCSCGTSFSRKDKLFGHITFFEGHMPAIPAEVVAEDDGKAAPTPPVDDDLFFDELDSIDDDFCIQDLLGAGSNSGFDWNL